MRDAACFFAQRPLYLRAGVVGMMDEPIFYEADDAPTQDDSGIGTAVESLGGALASRILAVQHMQKEVRRSRIEICRENVRQKILEKKLDEEMLAATMEVFQRQADEFFVRRMNIFEDALIAAELVEWALAKKKKALRAASVPTAAQAEEAAAAARAAAAERERVQRERDRERRRTAFGSAPRRHVETGPMGPTAEEEARSRAIEDVQAIVNSGRFLTLPVSPGIRSAVERTVHYMRMPGDRPDVGIYREVQLKKQLSARSAKDYERTKKQITEELTEIGAVTTWDKIAYLVSAAQMLEVSGYKRLRAGLLRMAEEHADHVLCRAIRAMPHYTELCARIERTPSKRSTAITHARRAAQSEKLFLRLLARLSPQYADTVAVMRYTGCRAVEASSVQLAVEEGHVRVSIRNAKTGARKRDKDKSVRVFEVQLSAPEGQLLADIARRRGPQPCAGQSSEAIRAAWARARRWEGVQADEHWCLHALRHQFARDYKRGVYARMKAQHGPDWREQLYGEGWADSESYAAEVYGPLAAMLGHTSTAMAKVYG